MEYAKLVWNQFISFYLNVFEQCEEQVAPMFILIKILKQTYILFQVLNETKLLFPDFKSLCIRMLTEDISEVI